MCSFKDNDNYWRVHRSIMRKKVNPVVLRMYFDSFSAHKLFNVLLLYFQILNVVVLFISYCITTVNDATKCIDSTDSKTAYSSLNGDIDYRKSLFTEGWKQDWLKPDFCQLLYVGVDEVRSSCPSKLWKGSNHALMALTSRTWVFRANVVQCRNSSPEMFNNSKEKNHILKRAGCEYRFYEYEETDIVIPIVNVCEQPRERLTITNTSSANAHGPVNILRLKARPPSIWLTRENIWCTCMSVCV